MEPRREEPQAPMPCPGERQTPEERPAPAVRLVRPFRIERLEERLAPTADYYLKINFE
jgi:hypothetical protein